MTFLYIHDLLQKIVCKYIIYQWKSSNKLMLETVAVNTNFVADTAKISSCEYNYETERPVL